jgi:hypothetical protein
MNRKPNRPLNTELADLERELAALTLQVAAIRDQVNTGPPITRCLPSIGDRVRFNVAGADSEGVIVGITARRVRIRQDVTGHTVLRAPHNVTLI